MSPVSLQLSDSGCNLIYNEVVLLLVLLSVLLSLLLGLTDPVPGGLPPQPLLLPQGGVEEGGVRVGELPVSLPQLEVPIHVP